MSDRIEEIANDLEDLLSDMDGVGDVARVRQDNGSVVFGFTRNGVGYSLMLNETE